MSSLSSSTSRLKVRCTRPLCTICLKLGGASCDAFSSSFAPMVMDSLVSLRRTAEQGGSHLVSGGFSDTRCASARGSGMPLGGCLCHVTWPFSQDFFGSQLMITMTGRPRRVVGQGEGQVFDSMEDGSGVGRSHRGLGTELWAPGLRLFPGGPLFRR